ncbi:protein of unknown function UPF0102 [Beutenbergia cavernae DSM 12333]|uniref:UPF0102 protein Bcav_2532 n=1 Tax=Beutenbergia cavernae (strain ATCC BAA-8 / DSM 12333 / CCUG 43141 / JCM 11478 / NBRC 16432 / NCIMB 13614 / HKI 0122) TaxID=471853 RepID=Y2532_BEUC1|nr:YraN family protein [Beutenbergia cavernae]C5BWW3.1 RecName: Full=UPF0102 protein Bcav_2532 [Beutenbergia cavernae DSM 12333]ACQ80779.1 protein of unknown function UPF0102 [Beutenbergia cavernae DSM 12333]
MRAKDAIGAYGERVAGRWLEAEGLEVVERNWRCPDGELDLVARDGETLVFVEVKTRSSLAFGHPGEAVTRLKLARLRRLAARWLAEHDAHAREVRIDVVAVLRTRAGAARVEHLRGVG